MNMQEEASRASEDYRLDDLIESENASDYVNSTLSEVDNRESKNEDYFIEILKVWKDEKKSEQGTRNVICVVMLGLMIAQVWFVNSLIADIARGTSSLEEWTLRLIIVGVFAEIVGIINIIVSNLFPKNGSKDFLEFLQSYNKE